MEHGTARERIARADSVVGGQGNALTVAVIVERVRHVQVQAGIGGKHGGGAADLLVGFIIGAEILAGEIVVRVPALHGFLDRARPLQHGILVFDVVRLDHKVVSGGNGAVMVFKRSRADKNVSARKQLG